jgi:putative hemolysin
MCRRSWGPLVSPNRARRRAFKTSVPSSNQWCLIRPGRTSRAKNPSQTGVEICVQPESESRGSPPQFAGINLQRARHIGDPRGLSRDQFHRGQGPQGDFPDRPGSTSSLLGNTRPRSRSSASPAAPPMLTAPAAGAARRAARQSIQPSWLPPDPVRISHESCGWWRRKQDR